MQSYGRRLRQRRREKELTHAEVAVAAKIAIHTLIDVEYGRLKITKGAYEGIMGAMEELPEKLSA
jgi:cytoskeletal protein RodZ